MQNVSMYVTRDTTTALKLPNGLKVTARTRWAEKATPQTGGHDSVKS